jgi:hypothetical protein
MDFTNAFYAVAAQHLALLFGGILINFLDQPLYCSLGDLLLIAEMRQPKKD